jgi:hypothetical protein
LVGALGAVSVSTLLFLLDAAPSKGLPILCGDFDSMRIRHQWLFVVLLSIAGCSSSTVADIEQPVIETAPTSSSSPKPVLDSRQQLREKLRALLGEERIPRVALWERDLTIQLVISLKATKSETRASTEEEVATILHEAIAFDFWDKISIEGYATTTDNFGRSQTAEVLTATYQRWAVEKIYWPHFDPSKVLKIKTSGNGWDSSWR